MTNEVTGSVPATDVATAETSKRDRVLALIGRRLVRAILVAWGVSLLAFAIVRIVPGDPVATLLGEEATPDRVEVLRERLHLDGSVVSQYGSWMGDVVRGDLGQSLQSTRPVLDTIGDRLPISLWLVGLGMVFALILAIPLGVLGGLTRSNWYKQGFGLGSAALIATPPFVTGVLLLLVFGVRLKWLPVAGYVDTFPQNLEYLLLPAIAIGIPVGMIFAIVLQESIRETNAEEFVETGWSGGSPSPVRLALPALRLPSPPVIGLMGNIVGANLAAAWVVERVQPGGDRHLPRGGCGA